MDVGCSNYKGENVCGLARALSPLTPLDASAQDESRGLAIPIAEGASITMSSIDDDSVGVSKQQPIIFQVVTHA